MSQSQYYFSTSTQLWVIVTPLANAQKVMQWLEGRGHSSLRMIQTGSNARIAASPEDAGLGEVLAKSCQRIPDPKAPKKPQPKPDARFNRDLQNASYDQLAVKLAKRTRWSLLKSAWNEGLGDLSHMSKEELVKAIAYKIAQNAA